MTLDEIKFMVCSPKYDFLRTNPHLQGKLFFLTLGGSYAYGTNTETSDVDIRGCVANSRQDLLGFGNFEQVVDTTTDTTVYAFNKLLPLLMNCNPNTIELLGCKPETYFVLTDIGRYLLDHRHLFLSKRAVNSFGGYATQQLRRLENAIARDKLPQSRKEEHTLNSMKAAFDDAMRQLTRISPEGFKLYIDKTTRENMDTEIFADIDLKHYSIREFRSLMNNLGNVIGTYEKIGHRNHKKDDAHLNKHAMHLVRLYHMCFEILEQEEIHTYRDWDHAMLMGIRNGEYQREDGTYRQEFFDMITEYEARLQYDAEHTSLPESPDVAQVEEFVMSVNEMSLKL